MRAIRNAGRSVFLRLGFEQASMDLIAAEAKVSKQTIYNHFRNKEDLFKAIIMDMTNSLMAPLDLEESAKLTPEQLLRSFGSEFLTLMLGPSSLALYRLIVAESGRFPELGNELYRVGSGRLIGVLADYFTWETTRGRLAVMQPDRAAELFVGMLSGRVQLRALLGVDETPSREELHDRVEHAVSSFLRLYAVPAYRVAPEGSVAD
nr:TetR/AcrR family transcriptional regulator [Sneathiella chungangensis]